MSRITLAPNASGTGTLTLAAPNTNTDRTLTLPDATTTLVGTDATQTLSNKTIAASQLTGALPAIDGSALTGIATGGMTLLGTLATTSGTTVTLSGLDLTSYKFVVAVLKTVSITIDAGIGILGNGVNASVSLGPTTGGNANGLNGVIQINLTNGVYLSGISSLTTTLPHMGAAVTPYSGSQTAIGTTTTSIGFSVGGGTFDLGSILIYGVK